MRFLLKFKSRHRPDSTNIIFSPLQKNKKKAPSISRYSGRINISAVPPEWKYKNTSSLSRTEYTRRHGNGSAPRRLLLAFRLSSALGSPFIENSSAVLSPPTARFENRPSTTLLLHRFDFSALYHAFLLLSRVFAKKFQLFSFSANSVDLRIKLWYYYYKSMELRGICK